MVKKAQQQCWTRTRNLSATTPLVAACENGMVPVLQSEGAKKILSRVDGPVLKGPFDVLTEASGLRLVRRALPASKNKRRSGCEPGRCSLCSRKTFPKRLPLHRPGTDALV
jgi:hypothetical protein